MYGYLVRKIMILDLRKLKRSGKEREDFFFEYTPQKELIELPEAQIALPIKVNGTVCLTGEHSAIVEGEVDYVIKGECTRCLENTEKTFLLDFNESVEENNLDGYSVKNDTIDLTKIVDDLIMINSPITFLCSEDCKGICLECGENLNNSQCKCKNR